MSKIAITPPSNFNFKKCLSFLNHSPMEPTHEVGEDYFRKLLFIASTPILLEIREVENKLVVKNLTGGKLNVAWKHAIHHQVSQWFDLNTDIEPFYKMAKNDAILCKAVEENSGLRLLGIPNLLEAITWAIIRQSAPSSYAYKLKKNLVEKYGDHFKFEDKNYYTFPKANTLANLKVQDLIDLNISQRKSEYIIGVAQLIEAKKLNKEQLMELSIHDAKQQLMDIRGIGPWTANFTISKCLEDKDSLSLKDSHLKRVLKKILKLSDKPEEKMLTSVRSKWAPWRSYATLYLRQMA